MDNPTLCSDCIYWAQEIRKDKKPVGQCKVDGPQMGPNGYGFWPITGVHEWCAKGERKTKPMLTESDIKRMEENGELPTPDTPPPIRVISEDI